jgi:hypothetical protein
MSRIGKEKPSEYSDKFDELRQHRVETSFYKYGTAKDNFGMGLVNALESHELCLQKYLHTGNTEYLCDAANYLMFEFMYPSRKDAYFKATSSEESAGVSGTPVNQLYEDKHFNQIAGR